MLTIEYVPIRLLERLELRDCRNLPRPSIAIVPEGFGQADTGELLAPLEQAGKNVVTVFDAT